MLPRTEHPPVRAAHLGLGAFHRAHQAWYTQRAGAVGDPWGIAGFTGRSPHAARVLAAQDGLYTLIERGPERDAAEVVQAIVGAYDGADPEWERTLARPEVGVVTVTVSEAGYAPGALPARRLSSGLRARRDADAGPIAVVSCDNLLGNGRVLAAAVDAVADPELRAWIAQSVSFVDSMVDRITPAATAADRAVARALIGSDDAAPVVTEPFTEWVLAGRFPAGRPAWEAGGARFVDDVAPYERRKLWLLNAGHSLLAYGGLLRGHATVAEAFADAGLRALLEQLWDEQRAVIDLPAEERDAATAALRERFSNARIRHALEQIAAGGAHKLPQRVVAPLRERIGRGLAPGAAQREVVAMWVECLLRFGADDAAGARIAAAAQPLPAASRVDAVLDILTKEGSIP